MKVHKVGVATGAFLGLWHLVWSLLILLGWAQGLLNFVFSMHSLNNPYKVMPFDITHAVTLIIVTSVIGYVVGSVFATIYNKVHK